jgi:hypothetical protein
MIRNGVDVEKLAETVKAVKADPKNAQVKFMANTKWMWSIFQNKDKGLCDRM